MFDVAHPEVRGAIERALAEDLGTGDITSQLTVAPEQMAQGSFIAKQDLVLAGVELLPFIYELLGGASVEVQKSSGARLAKGDTLAAVQGPARILLSAERVALNFMQRLSGVATLAARYVQAVAGTKVIVLDTRKTTPGLRQLEKMAVQAGGATNHRSGLYDAVLIKNNHITAAGGVTQALRKAQSFAGPIEIEVRTRAELEEALAANATSLLLDNLAPSEAAEWIRYIDGRARVELSGNITLDTIRAYAEGGPDYISSGAMTHSAAAVDIHFQLHLA